MSSSLLNVITYYQRSIEKNGHDEKRLLHCIEKLYKLPVKLEHLQTTGVGKTVNALRKYDREVGVAAKALVAKWKAMVAAEALVEDEEDDEIQPDTYDDDNDDNDNSPANNNSQADGENNNSSEDQKNSHHAKHEHSSSSGSKDKSQYFHESSSRSKSYEHRSRSNHSSSKHRHGEKYAKSSRREDNNRKRDKHEERSNSITKEPIEIEDRNAKDSPKMSIVEEIEQDFEVLEDDDEEKLVIDVSKEKTEEIDKNLNYESQNLSKHLHHSNKDKKKNSNHKKEESYSKEKSSKESGRNKDISRKEHKYSKENVKKENNNSKDNSQRDNSSHIKENSQREKTTKDNSGSSSSSRHSRDREKEKSVEKREKKEDRNDSEENHKTKGSELKDKEKEKKKREDGKHSSSSHRSNGEHYKNKHKSRDHDKDKDYDKSSKEMKRKNSDSDSKSSESSPTKVKVPKLLVDGIDSSMGTSFEEALGMISASSSTKGSSKSSKTSPRMSSSSTSSGSSGVFAKPRSPTRTKTPPLLTSAVKLEPLDPSIALELPTIPTISPNYKPLPLNPTVMECVFSSNKPQRRYLTDDEAMSAGISSKTIRTKVYSGIKTGALLQVPTLFDLCIRVLQKNIDALEYTGGVPFEVLKPVLERATPQQLITFEEFNPYLMEDSDTLWQQHCVRHCRGQKRQEFETWREMFLRCKEEQERKLNMLAENIKQSQMQTQQPVRKTQLAYVDSMVKPPRNVQRKQEQYGTKSSSSATPAARVAALSNMTPNASKAGDFRLRAAASVPDTVQIAVAATSANNGRPKKAPLMQKTIKFMKGRFRR